ncbi:MAG TPA: 2-oxo-4-hydroxy-4-carboxy-5-ureidoimidazoline decarboxylase [Gaiellaceae bacterium]|nr:2-oxo-4-hydroxy-4-carboxy-5-ureidoimidazoline decarboxylase [Gaiellaceae bacterium]
MHELPRQLSENELAELFEGHTRFVEQLARLENPLAQARKVLADAPEEEQIEALGTHPRIGQRVNISEVAAKEQGSDEDPVLLAALVKLNKSYEQKFGFRFVVFVDGRPRAEVLSVLRQRLQNSRDEELAAGLDDLVAIALDRWRKR